jgi:hypothetical protein
MTVKGNRTLKSSTKKNYYRMKSFFSIAAILLTLHGFGQSSAETDISKLSQQIFDWEVANKIDLLSGLLSEKFSVVNSRGEIQTKEQYLATLRSGNVQHDSIAIEKSLVTIVEKTATVIGRGWFHMTVSGNQLHRHLSYMEVFTKDDKSWKLIALYASVLPD